MVGNASGLVTFGSIKHWYDMLERLLERRRMDSLVPLFSLMGFALALVLSTELGKDRQIALRWFVIQFLNLAWTPVFFGWHRMDVALAVIGLLVVAVAFTVRQFGKVHRFAGWLLVPYLLGGICATLMQDSCC